MTSNLNFDNQIQTDLFGTNNSDTDSFEFPNSSGYGTFDDNNYWSQGGISGIEQ